MLGIQVVEPFFQKIIFIPYYILNYVLNYILGFLKINKLKFKNKNLKKIAFKNI